jgi:hypothetical protein
MTARAAQEVLRLAFQDIRPSEGSGCKSISHKDAVEFYRGNLITFSKADFEYYLPRVLIELLESHASTPDENDDVENVLRLLNVEPSPTDAQWEEKTFGTDAAQYSSTKQEELAAMRRRRFENFTPDQAEAILGFLSAAQSWKDSENWAEELRDALAYWRRRVATAR